MDFTDPMIYVEIVIVLIGLLFIVSGFKIIRPTHRAVIERLGKYKRFKASGMIWVTPIIEKLYAINITEQMTEVDKQEIITLDNLNATVSAQIYHKVNEDEESVKNAFYKVNNVERQIVALAQTTMRNIIGAKDFKEVNSKRQDLNSAIKESISEQTKNWGIAVVRCELREIEPPTSVQETMNNVIMAQNKKQAALDLATATATQADGERQAQIKRSEGEQQATINRATGEAKAIIAVAEAKAKEIELINTSIRTNFKDNAVIYRQFEVNENALKDNTKIVFTEKGVSPVVVVGSNESIVPLPKNVVSSSMTNNKDYSN